MCPLVRVEAQGARDRLEHLRRRVDVPALLEPRVPGDSHSGELRHFFAAQARRAPAPRARQPHLLGPDPLTPVAQERGELATAGSVPVEIELLHIRNAHLPSMAKGVEAVPGGADTRITTLWSRVSRSMHSR